MQHPIPDNSILYGTLRQVFGYDSFRPGQQELVEALLAGQDALGVMPTGAGKSLCFQLPALLMEGITVVVSPLVSLMNDQVTALVAMGVRAAYFNQSLTPGQYQKALGLAMQGRYKIIYVAPERLNTPRFQALAQTVPIDMVVVDEAHCVSQWGMNFRPDYLAIADFIAGLPKRPVVAAFTATATGRVRADMVELLRLADPVQVTTGFDRPNLYFGVVKPRKKDDALLELLAEHGEESAIVYCATRKETERVAGLLTDRGIDARAYHAGMEQEDRRRNQEDFVFDRARVMVATNAFGMGIDKSNVRLVVHYNMPKDLESYYQEAGRAGRDGEAADCILLYAPRDVKLAEFLIEKSEPAPGLTEDQQAALLENDREKLRQMTFYSTTSACLRGRVRRYFGEYAPADCGYCSNCAPRAGLQALERQPDWEFEYDQEAERRAAADRAAARRRTAAQQDGLPYDTDLYARLKELRGILARKQGVPAYVVFTDATLRAMCRMQPQDLAAMSRVPGVGESKLRRYGPDFLTEIHAWKTGQA